MHIIYAYVRRRIGTNCSLPAYLHSLTLYYDDYHRYYYVLPRVPRNIILVTHTPFTRNVGAHRCRAEARRYSRRPHFHIVLIVTGTQIYVRSNNNNKYSAALVHFRLDAVRCCLPGDQKLVAKGGRSACRCCVTDGGEVTLFFRSRAGRRCRHTNRFGRVLPGGAHRRRSSPPRPYYIDHAALLSLLYGCSSVSARATSSPPTVGYCGPDAAAAADDDDEGDRQIILHCSPTVSGNRQYSLLLHIPII